MSARDKGIIGTIVAVVLCGCPGLLLCVFGGLVAAGAPVNTELNGVTDTTTFPAWVGISLLCVALIFILIPVVVGFLTLRTKPAPAPAAPASTNEPLPPTS